MKQTFSTIKTLLLAVILSFGLSYALAWTAPTATPPGGNVGAPINTSTTPQTKAGAFTISATTTTGTLIAGGLGVIANSLTTSGITFGDGTLQTTSAGVKNLIAGANITISPVGGTGAVTVNAVGSTGVYFCPVKHSCWKVSDTCNGNLSNSATCAYFVDNGSSNTACGSVNTVAQACAYVGRLLP